MKLLAFFLLAALAAFPCMVKAQDNLAARQVAAVRYLEIVPIAPVVEEAIAALALRRQPVQRRHFVEGMHLLVDRRALAAAVRDTMASTFTLEELQALIVFYQTPQGASIAAKMPVYNGVLTPLLLDVLARAGERYEEGKKGRR